MAARTASALRSQLDDYLIPRLRRLDAPLLAVVGGSTGAGKSTLVNGLVRAPVTTAGVLRPTTRTPVLVCHPADTPWFAQQSLLPGWARSSRAGEQTLQIINATFLTPGLALLDAPDIDSVVSENRRLADQFLAAADLWLFVTTAARYADAVPWRLLRDARGRGTAVGVVLDRVPADTREEIAAHFAGMLADQELGDAPLFVVAESALDGQGLLPELEVLPVKRWLDAIARDGVHRRAVTTRTLIGAIDGARRHLESLAVAADEQVAAATRLARTAEGAFGTAVSDVELMVRRGGLLGGDVAARWQELVSSGELRQALRARSGPRRSQVNEALADRPPPGRRFGEAVVAALADLITELDITANQHLRQEWRALQPGRVLLAAEPGLGRPWPGFADAAHDLAHGWRSWLRTTIRHDAPRVRTRGRSYATAATVLLATVATIAPTGSDTPDAGAGSELLGRVVGHEGIVPLAERARAELARRVQELFGVELARHLAPLRGAWVDVEASDRLRAAANRIGSARAAFVAGWGDAA